MHATMKQMLKTATLRAELATSAYGTPAPTLRIALPNGTHYRLIKAVLHHVAATIELSVPSDERWCVEIDRMGENSGTVAIELMHGTPAESERAMALLQRVAREAS
jgi:hypothetical protein